MTQADYKSALRRDLSFDKKINWFTQMEVGMVSVQYI